MPDAEKWTKDATSAEVAEALVRVRGATHHLYGMIKALQAGNQAAFTEAERKFVEVDDLLSRVINRVGGFDGPK